ncbi:hypothetical protein N7481_003098 [Penicillium waksmanii]|uniref:uncharacterized protein n=1 Tax=Penicillium waksmanii TaxID=69791 RepID=UPI0025479C61|nr:uncharacterized protein N7481_003098 [Penicillium waksmanii]KAJ5987888.1 hypothetical protein N7481_003098 [Penicillium waksmanii]
METPQVPAAAYVPGGPSNEPTTALPTTTTPANNTTKPRPPIYDYEKPTKWAEFKRMWKGGFEDDAEKSRWSLWWAIFIGTLVFIGAVLLLVLIGVYYHPSPDRINGPTSTSTTKTHRATATTLKALIPASSDNGQNIHVAMVRPTDAPLPKPAPVQYTEAVFDAQVEKMRKEGEASLLETRAFSRVPAPPYLDACQVNSECDWGYRCIEGTCYPGCDSNRDCRDVHKCNHWKHDGPSFKYCMVGPHKECSVHLDFCRNDDECCSGRCKSKGKWKLCQPSKGRQD